MRSEATCPTASYAVGGWPASPLAEPATFAEFALGSRGQPVSTTMAFARLLRNLLRDPGIGRYVVPIVPDEGRTFGLDALFAEVKIYAPEGQLYKAVDAGLLLSYSEDRTGQILEEGITEAGAMASFQAAGTSYATWSLPMLPIYLFYSMFGFQRVGDLIWQAADARARGFLMGCTAGRTTMNGEGLQHEDGHSLAARLGRADGPRLRPGLRLRDGDHRRAWHRPHVRAEGGGLRLLPHALQRELPNAGAPCAGGRRGSAGVRGGGHKRRGAPRHLPLRGTERGRGCGRSATILFSGPAWQAAMQARELLASDWDVSAEAWSVTSYKALREDGLEVERWNRLHPESTPRVAYVTRALSESRGPIVAVTDYLKAVPDQVARFVRAPFTVLGTDGFGRSDTRAALRRHFEVDAAHIVVAVLAELAAAGDGKPDEVATAIERYGIDPEAIDPREA